MMRAVFRRKRLVLLLSLSILLFPLSGCSTRAESQPLRILVDTYYENAGFFSQKTLKKDFSAYVNYTLGLEQDDLDLEFLPTDETERELRISALRTEIMSGGGPDVFLLGCNVPGWEKHSTSGAWNDKPECYGSMSRLFPDVRASMENGVFLPLDEYMEKAQWLDISLLHPVVLEAGRTEDGQMVLPITFTFPYAVYSSEKLENPESLSTAWDQDNSAVRSAYADIARTQFPDLFGELADYKQEELLFSRDELLETVQAVLEQGTSAQQADAFLYTASLDSSQMFFWRPGHYDWDAGYSNASEELQSLTAVHNFSSGVTADITAYICINRNTKRPEDAFRVADFMFKTEVQSMRGEQDPENKDLCYQSLLLLECFGLPARNDLLENTELPFNGSYVSAWSIAPDSNEELFKEYTELRQEVTSARFYGPLDEELQTMFEACMEAGSDEEVEEIVSKAYITMQMLLAES